MKCGAERATASGPTSMQASQGRAPRRRRRRSARGEEGGASIEFVIIFPILLTILLSTIEIGVLMIRQIMLDKATDMAVRTLRLGMWEDPTHDALKTYICDRTVILPDCEENLLVELSPVSKTTWSPLPTSATCVDKSADIQPVTEFRAGLENEMMMVRVCALQQPLYPTTGLGLQLPRHDPDHYALISMSAFVNEPG